MIVTSGRIVILNSKQSLPLEQILELPEVQEADIVLTAKGRLIRCRYAVCMTPAETPSACGCGEVV